jgi:hypothetical protein
MQSAANQSPQPNSLLTGKLTGNFANPGLSQRLGCLAAQRIQRLAGKLPTRRNREFSNAYQGKFFKEQGIFMPDASILNFEQPQPTFAGTAPAKRP